MGVTLANTAYSVNIKERLDFSCALFDAEGNLIANAPHMPVHLGSMGESVRTIIDRRAGTMRPGDAFVLNAPYNGGTHLPDVTVIAPVFLRRARAGVLRREPRPSRRHRRHHAGLDAARLDARRRGRRAARQRRAGRRGPLPRSRDARDPRRRPLSRRATSTRTSPTSARRSPRARRARRSSRRWSRTSALPVVRAYMQHVQDNAEESVRRVLDVLTDGRFEYEMDSGARIAVADLDRQGERARRPSTSRARARSSRPTSTRRPPCARRRSSTSSARSSTTRSR